MTTQQQAYALSLSDELLKGMWVPNVLQNESALRARAAQELRRLHAENETLRAGHAAARLEIESLKERVQQLGQLARDVNSRRVQELEAQLEAVGAGGVEPLRKRECLHQITEPDHFRGATKLIAAARQALEALDWLPTSKHSQALWHRQQPALAAIREALEAEPQPAAQAAPASPASIEQEAMQMLWNDQQQEEKEHYRNVARGAERIK